MPVSAPPALFDDEVIGSGSDDDLDPSRAPSPSPDADASGTGTHHHTVPPDAPHGHSSAPGPDDDADRPPGPSDSHDLADAHAVPLGAASTDPSDASGSPDLAKEQLAALRHSIETMSSSISSLHQQNREAVEQFSEQERVNQQLLRTLDQISGERDRLAAHARELEGQFQENGRLRARLLMAEQDLATLSTLQHQLRALREELLNGQRDNDGLRDAADRAAASVRRYQTQLDHLSRENEELRQRPIELTAALETHASSIDQLLRELRTANDLLERIRGIVQVEPENDLADGLEAIIDGLGNDRNRLREENEALLTRLEEQEALLTRARSDLLLRDEELIVRDERIRELIDENEDLLRQNALLSRLVSFQVLQAREIERNRRVLPQPAIQHIPQPVVNIPRPISARFPQIDIRRFLFHPLLNLWNPFRPSPLSLRQPARSHNVVLEDAEGPIAPIREVRPETESPRELLAQRFLIHFNNQLSDTHGFEFGWRTGKDMNQLFNRFREAVETPQPRPITQNGSQRLPFSSIMPSMTRRPAPSNPARLPTIQPAAAASSSAATQQLSSFEQYRKENGSIFPL